MSHCFFSAPYLADILGFETKALPGFQGGGGLGVMRCAEIG
jgi:hypothetical protein